MPTIDHAEKAAEFLRETAPTYGDLVEQHELKTHMLKHVEGMEVASSTEPVTIRREVVRGGNRWMEAAGEAAIAAGELAKLRERRDAAKVIISLYQSSVKERM